MGGKSGVNSSKEFSVVSPREHAENESITLNFGA